MLQIADIGIADVIVQKSSNRGNLDRLGASLGQPPKQTLSPAYLIDVRFKFLDLSIRTPCHRR